MEIFLNWLIALGVILLISAGLYLIIKMAVKSAVREAVNEVGRELARKLWEEDEKAQPAPAVQPVREPLEQEAPVPPDQEPQDY